MLFSKARSGKGKMKDRKVYAAYEMALRHKNAWSKPLTGDKGSPFKFQERPVLSSSCYHSFPGQFNHHEMIKIYLLIKILDRGSAGIINP